jgi:hypothetical protein
MNITKLIHCLAFLLIGFNLIFAQYEYPESGEVKNSQEHKQKKDRSSEGLDKESRVFYGGNVGVSFGTITYIELAPTIGYKFTERLWSGIGPEYLYFGSKDLDYHTNIYGFRNFASFAVLKDIDKVINLNIGSIFLYAENEVLNIKLDKVNRNWYDLLLGGFGVRMPIGNRSGFSILVLFRLNESAALLYSNPEIRLSIDI